VRTFPELKALAERRPAVWRCCETFNAVAGLPESRHLRMAAQGSSIADSLVAVERAKKRGERWCIRRWISREPIDERFVKAPINDVMRRVKAKSGR
jgi:hypothetical protein